MSKTDDRYLKKFLKNLPEHIPSVLLFHTPPMGKHGDKIDIRLEVTEKISDDTPLMVELLNQEGDLLIDPIPINFPNLTASFTIPKKIDQGIYFLNITYNDCTLESTTFNIVDAESAQEVAEFDKGLEIEEKVSQAIEEGDYDQAINLQEKAERHFIKANNPELAAYSWEKLAELLSNKNNILLLQKTLEKALEIYSSLEGLENKEEILKRIREKIEIYQRVIKDDPPSKQPKNNIQLLREKKGYSQEQLAVLLGVNRELIQAWEKGQGFEELIRYFELAQELSCEIDDLIEIKHKLPNKITESSLTHQIHSNIRNLRDKKEYSQEQLAVLLGVRPELIQAWEEGQGFEELIRYFELAQVLNYQLSDLIGCVDGTITSKSSESIFS